MTTLKKHLADKLPEPFNRVQIGRVRRQILQADALLVGLGLDPLSVMVTGIIDDEVCGLCVVGALRRLDRTALNKRMIWSGFVLTLINPLFLWDVGFQLSFVATLGLIVLIPPLERGIFWPAPTRNLGENVSTIPLLRATLLSP